MKTTKIIKAILYIIIGLTIIFIHAHFVQYLKYYISSIMIMYGFFEILINAIEDKEFYKKYPPYFGIIEIFIGLIMIFKINNYEDVCVIWAIWSIFRESFQIQEIFEKKIKLLPAILMAVETLVVLSFSTMMLIEPGEHQARFHAYLLVIELLLSGGLLLFESYLLKEKKEKKEN